MSKIYEQYYASYITRRIPVWLTASLSYTLSQRRNQKRIEFLQACERSFWHARPCFREKRLCTHTWRHFKFNSRVTNSPSSTSCPTPTSLHPRPFTTIHISTLMFLDTTYFLPKQIFRPLYDNLKILLYFYQ